MLVAMSIGSTTAIFSAWWLMGGWLSGGSETFVWLFVFTGASMVIASGLAFVLAELPDSDGAPAKSLWEIFQSGHHIIRSDANFRMLALVSICFGMGVTLMPHYQAFVKDEFAIKLVDFVPWVIAQNLGAALMSVPLGRLADRVGNRLVLRTVMLALCAAPLLTLILVNLENGQTKYGFYVVFFLMGLMPVSMRTFNNYTLEIADRDSQPIYLSLLGIFMAIPVVTMSVLVGWAMDVVGFQMVFLTILLILLFGWTLTFRLIEPRTIKRSS